MKNDEQRMAELHEELAGSISNLSGLACQNSTKLDHLLVIAKQGNEAKLKIDTLVAMAIASEATSDPGADVCDAVPHLRVCSRSGCIRRGFCLKGLPPQELSGPPGGPWRWVGIRQDAPDEIGAFPNEQPSANY